MYRSETLLKGKMEWRPTWTHQGMMMTMMGTQYTLYKTASLFKEDKKTQLYKNQALL